MALSDRLIAAAAASLLAVVSGTAIAETPAAKPAPAAPAAAPQADEDDASTPAPLTVGSLAIASDNDLVVDSMALDVSVDKVIYAYQFRNKGKNKLSLAATVALPDLEVNNESNTEYDLPSQSAENPVGLVVSVDGKLVPTQPHVQAVALGVDRLADLKAAQLPLIPFGDDIDKALTDAKPDTITKLQGLGLITPRDPAQPATPPLADWSLRVVHALTLDIEPAATSKTSIGFAPIKAVYTIDAQSLGGFDALKDQVCLTPQVIAGAKALLKPKGATLQVADITLANDGPARWLDNPAATVSVHKPKTNAIVTFCGIDASTSGQPVVTGKVPGSNEAAGLRILIFAPNS